MCGIAGIVDARGIKAQVLNEMSATLRHRGPDDEGFLILDRLHQWFVYRGKDTVEQLSSLPLLSEASIADQAVLALLHRRLSIIDLSASGHQPMSHAWGKYNIIFNGEVYNFPEIRKELEKHGEKFVTSSDTEVVLRAYMQWGKDCVHRFVGMWAFAILDMDKQAIFLSRDRFGIKPLYYTQLNGTFAFASEIKALLPVCGRNADVSSVFQYIAFGATSRPDDVLFSYVRQLPPAHHLWYDIQTGRISTECYYDLAKTSAGISITESEATEKYTALLSDSLKLHLRSDVRIGSALSGGLDSSTIVALAASSLRPDRFSTFTAAYHIPEIDESRYARMVADRYPNIEAVFTYPEVSDYWTDLDRMIHHQDLPIHSTSMYAQWQVMKTASAHGIKVLLDGQGADESLGGYYNFAGTYLLDLLKQGRFLKYRQERKQLSENFTQAVNTAMARAFYYHLPGSLQRSIRKNQRIGMQMVSEKYSALLSGLEVPERGATSFRELSVNSMLYGMQDLLRYEDRNSMAYSIESRVPFLDHRLVEFSLALSSDRKISNGWTKYVLRKTAEPLLPAELVWRKDKMGFLTPQQLWLEQSRANISDLLNNSDVPEFLDRKKLLAASKRVMTDSSQLSEFWKIISFIRWANVFKVKFTGKEL